jgi:hypothetical protein
MAVKPCSNEVEQYAHARSERRQIRSLSCPIAVAPASEASAEPYALDRVEPSVLNRAFCSSLRPS